MTAMALYAFDTAHLLEEWSLTCISENAVEIAAGWTAVEIVDAEA